MKKAVNFRAVPKKTAKIITISFRHNGEKITFTKTQKTRKRINFRKKGDKLDE